MFAEGCIGSHKREKVNMIKARAESCWPHVAHSETPKRTNGEAEYRKKVANIQAHMTPLDHG
jgi:hypothetical protein